MQDRASGFHGLDLTEVFEQIERHGASNADLVRRLSHLPSIRASGECSKHCRGAGVPHFTHFG
jgi:hypothetical protein